MLRRLTEKIPDARRPYPNKHLDEVRPGNAEKRYPRFASHSASQQRLTRARRPDQQHPLRNSTAESLIFLRVLEKLHHLDQFFLRLIDAFDIREGNTGFFLDIDLRLALADLHQPAPGPHPLEGVAPQKKKQYNGTTHESRVATHSLVTSPLN